MAVYANKILKKIDYLIELPDEEPYTNALYALRDVVQWLDDCRTIKRPDWAGTPDRITAESRLNKINEILESGLR